METTLRNNTGNVVSKEVNTMQGYTMNGGIGVKTATEVGVRAIQDHKVIEWNTCWKCRLSEGTDNM